MNRIALFMGSPRSLTGVLINLVTNCPYSHAAIEVDGTWYHASEKLGCFGVVDIESFSDRRCVIYEFEGNLSDWVEIMNGKKYDWRGIFGWAMYSVGLNRMSSGNPKQFYCFEAAINALYVARQQAMLDKRFTNTLDTALRNMLDNDPELKKPVSGCDIDNMFTQGQSCRFGEAT